MAHKAKLVQRMSCRLRSLENLTVIVSTGWKRLYRSLHTATTSSITAPVCETASKETDPTAATPPLSPQDLDNQTKLSLKRGEWTKGSRRTGLIAIKLGMTQLWDKRGLPLAVTILQVIDNQVVMTRTKEKEGYYGLQIGAIDHPKIWNVTKPVLGQFNKAGVPPKRKLLEFRVSEDAILPVGTSLQASHFVPGQYVDVCAKSIGKGFQGVMKRHHMKGQPASHGVTKTHRKMGATGGGQDPGRVFPGKKMPGRMGGRRVTSICRKVYRVNNRFGVLYVKGPVPGHKNTYVRITDSRRKPILPQVPFPTFIPEPDSPPLPEEVYSDDIHKPHEGSLLFPDKRKSRK